MTPKQLRTDLTNAFEGRDRDAFERALDRMEALFRYTGPVAGDRVTIPHPPGCARRGAACECTDDAQMATCMFRRPGS